MGFGLSVRRVLHCYLLVHAYHLCSGVVRVVVSFLGAEHAGVGSFFIYGCCRWGLDCHALVCVHTTGDGGGGLTTPCGVGAHPFPIPSVFGALMRSMGLLAAEHWVFGWWWC